MRYLQVFPMSSISVGLHEKRRIRKKSRPSDGAHAVHERRKLCRFPKFSSFVNRIERQRRGRDAPKVGLPKVGLPRAPLRIPPHDHAGASALNAATHASTTTARTAASTPRCGHTNAPLTCGRSQPHERPHTAARTRTRPRLTSPRSTRMRWYRGRSFRRARSWSASWCRGASC